MKTLRNENGFELEFNGSSTYQVISYTEDRSDYVIYGTVSTLRKANNIFNKAMHCAGF